MKKKSIYKRKSKQNIYRNTCKPIGKCKIMQNNMYKKKKNVLKNAQSIRKKKYKHIKATDNLRISTKIPSYKKFTDPSFLVYTFVYF